VGVPPVTPVAFSPTSHRGARPFLPVREEAFREVAQRSEVLGFDSKWVLHPGQLDAANAIYVLVAGGLRLRRADPRRLRRQLDYLLGRRWFAVG
jgi:hypothetical protein